jgi:hypothetical protein
LISAASEEEYFFKQGWTAARNKIEVDLPVGQNV